MQLTSSNKHSLRGVQRQGSGHLSSTFRFHDLMGFYNLDLSEDST